MGDRRRWVALGVTVAVGLAAIGVALWQDTRPSPPRQEAEETVVFRDQTFGWTLRYPARFEHQDFGGHGMFTYEGAWFGTWSAGIEPIEDKMNRLRAFPSSAVLLMVWWGKRLPAPPPLEDDAFPLGFSMVHRTEPYSGGEEPAPLYGQFWGNGYPFNVAVWFGPAAPPADRDALEAMVPSIRFPSLRSFSAWQDEYMVLGPASAYPVGSATFLKGSELPPTKELGVVEPFYLVHAPGGFYAVRSSTRMADGGICGISVEQNPLRFSCAVGLAWDRLGHKVGDADRPGDADIGPHPVTVAQDGHVLYSPFWGNVAEGDFWP